MTDADALRYALNQASIVAFTDSKGTITYVNDKFCQISKYSREELLGQNHRIVNSGYHPKEFFADLWKTIARGQVWKGEIKNRAKDGGYYWVFTTIVPFMTDNGHPYQYVSIRTDITEQKLSQEQAELQRAALVHSEKMASVGELAAGVAHELGNPLAAISGRMEFLELLIQSSKASQAEILNTIQTVKQLCDRMTSIIRGMKSLSRDGTRDAFQNASLNLLIKDVLSFATDNLQKHGIEIRFEPIDDRIQLCCQATQISQVLVNLINNARDAILSLDERWIRIEAHDKGKTVEIAVTDSGKGIPAELHEKIMEPFFTTKQMGIGSGLGLSVSKTIVDFHGGTLRIDPSSPNTRFIVSLPKKTR
ncbi:MAG: PAS domain-containing sensor histidine kinase [Deltaproteobacteria bacterium]|nr:PAS domain-containing sensor histidine kinase [Deltaproteobacteria bacterium]